MHSFLEIGEINVENDLAGGLSTVEAHTEVAEPKLGGHCPDGIGDASGRGAARGYVMGMYCQCTNYARDCVSQAWQKDARVESGK